MSRRTFFRVGILSLLALGTRKAVARENNDDLDDLKKQVAALAEKINNQLVESPPNVPIGTILPYAGPIDADHPLPAEWRLCDGSVVSTKDFEKLWKRLRMPQDTGFRGAWGGTGDPNFNLPDLRGLFLRGVDVGAGRDPDIKLRKTIKPNGNTGDAVGSLQPYEFGKHNHQTSGVTEDRVFWSSPRTSAEWKSGFGGGGLFADTNSGISRNNMRITITEIDKGGNETRPINASVNYIIRVK
jgi:microcystin-dependent protein